MSININKSESINNEDLLINSIDQYELGDKIGEGTFGKVIIATHKITKEKVAIKMLDKYKLNLKDERIRLDREIEVLKMVNHYNIIKLFTTIENESKIYIIQEYISGEELFEYIKSNKKLSEKEACLFYQQIVSGIEYLHKLGISHRDLKPENILLTNAKVLKIIDFGLSAFYSNNELLKTHCGSPCYAAPEMIEGKYYKGLPADIWSSGIILFLMLTGNLPFNELTNKKLYPKILNGKYNIPKYISKEGKDLIKKILEVNPKKRIKINEIKEHPWFNMVNRIFNMHDGIDLKKDVMPIDEDIVEKMKNLGFNKMQVRDNILRNYHNNITTTYYLILGKKIRENKESVADLYSYIYEKYLEDKNNKMNNFDNDIINVLKQRISSKGKIDNLPIYEENIKKNSPKKKRKNFDKLKEINNNIKENNSLKILSNNTEEENIKIQTPFISADRDNNNLNNNNIESDNDKFLNSSSPLKKIKIIVKNKKKKEINKNNDSLNKIRLNSKNQYTDSEPNNKMPNNLVSLNIFHQQRNRSVLDSTNTDKIKFSIIDEMKKTYKDKYKSKNISTNRIHSTNSSFFERKNFGNLNIYTSLGKDFFKKSKIGLKKNLRENSIGKSSNKNENKNYIYIKRNNKINREITNDNNDLKNEILMNKYKSNSVKNKMAISINVNLKKRLTNRYTKKLKLYHQKKNNSVKNVNNKIIKFNFFNNNKKTSETINIEKGQNETIKIIKSYDSKLEKQIKKDIKIGNNMCSNNTKEENYIPFDISMIFLLKKQKIIELLKKCFNENNIKFKKLSTNYKRFICSKNDSFIFQFIIDKNENYQNNIIKLKIIKGEKKTYLELIKSINNLIK